MPASCMRESSSTNAEVTFAAFTNFQMSQLTDVAADCGFGPDVAADRKKFLRIYFAEVADVAAITKTIRLGKHVDNEQRAAMEAVMAEKDVKAKKLRELLFEGNSWSLEMQEFAELQAEAGTAKVAHACLRGFITYRRVYHIVHKTPYIDKMSLLKRKNK